MTNDQLRLQELVRFFFENRNTHMYAEDRALIYRHIGKNTVADVVQAFGHNNLKPLDPDVVYGKFDMKLLEALPEEEARVLRVALKLTS